MKKKPAAKKKIIQIKPCPKCGLALTINHKKKYAFCVNRHYAFGLRKFGSAVFVALGEMPDTATWHRLKKTRDSNYGEKRK